MLKRRFAVSAFVNHAKRMLEVPAFARAFAETAVATKTLPLKPWLGRSGRGDAIRMLSLRITDLCNLRCHTCGQWGDNGYLLGCAPKTLRAKEVSPTRHRALLDDLVAHGHRPILHLWGGEPMMYDGILDVMSHARGLGLPSVINTNGHRVAARADALARLPLATLVLSVDGSCAEIHDAARPNAAGRGGNFDVIEEAIEAIAAARSRAGSGLPLVMTNTVISRRNQHDIWPLYRRFRDRVDALSFNLGYWIDTPAAEAHAEAHRRRFGVEAKSHFGWVGDWTDVDAALIAQQLHACLEDAAEHGISLSISPAIEPLDAETLRRYYTDHSARFGHEHCPSIFQIPEIDPGGELYPCRDYHDYVVGNVKTATISELWQSERYRRFRGGITRDGLLPACNRCCGLMGYQV